MIRRCRLSALALLARRLRRQGAAAAAAPAPRSRHSAAPPRGEPGQYLNLAAPACRPRFGTPAFVRKDGATEMWRYDGHGLPRLLLPLRRAA